MKDGVKIPTNKDLLNRVIKMEKQSLSTPKTIDAIVRLASP
jgi:hypothetical protein